MSVSGNPLEYLAAFWGGVLLSFTPCLYPIIPITASFIGIRAGTSRLKGLVLSSVYVAGIAVIYSILGIVASLTGKFFGAVSAHPLTHIFVGLVVILFGLSMLDIFLIPIPNFVKLPSLKSKGFFSIFFLGLTSGLVVSPCITPVLGAILTYVATKQNILYGATLLFSFAYGIGLILIIVGTFSTILISLPKSGKWMIYIKRLCALVLVGMGIYFIIKGIGRM